MGRRDPLDVRPELLRARRAVADVAVRKAMLVSATCDKCGRLPGPLTHSAAMDHTLRFRSHAVAVQALNTTIYRHPSRIPPTSTPLPAAPQTPKSGS